MIKQMYLSKENKIELAGYSKDQVEVSIVNNILYVTADNGIKKSGYWYIPQGYKIHSAKMKDGLLKIDLKKEEGIKIKVE